MRIDALQEKRSATLKVYDAACTMLGIENDLDRIQDRRIGSARPAAPADSDPPAPTAAYDPPLESLRAPSHELVQEGKDSPSHGTQEPDARGPLDEVPGMLGDPLHEGDPP